MNPTLLLPLLMATAIPLLPASARWSPERARAWMEARPWPVGCNYLPASAVNQLEMWQAPTFDPEGIDRELGWAEGLGFNSLRVFLHDLAYQGDPDRFLDRVDRFLAAADRHHLSVVLVIFDGVWNPLPKAGPQAAPRPGVHNSQWVQSPGAMALADGSRRLELERYVKALFGRFGRDHRILAWDLFNEPDNPNARSYPQTESPQKEALSLSLLKDTFAWAREAGPIQPLTAGVWRGEWAPAKGAGPVALFSLENSDILSFHCYDPIEGMKARVASLEGLGRPILCTEYMARPRGSRFQTILPFLKEKGIGAYNWGFVAGRSQTRYAWDTWAKPEPGEPHPWFHDVLRGDGSPYDPAEVGFLREALRGVPSIFGWMPDGAPVLAYRLANGHGLSCRILNYGCVIQELRAPDRAGKPGDIVLGYDSFDGYLSKGDPYFGAVVGRVGNRIAGARFSLDGRERVLAANNGPNHLHGGIRGFDKVLWRARYREGAGGPALELSYLSRDGEEGYPGNLRTKVTYRLTQAGELRIDYEATTDRDTPVNLTNHSYWNLAGRGDILGHRLMLRASRYTPVDAGLIPTGEISAVAGTPMDFTSPKPIGRDLPLLNNSPLGYDHNFVLDRDGPSLALAARVDDPSSGRRMEVLTDQPGVQFYTGNFLDGTVRGKGGRVYLQHAALCLETQHFPDAVHHPNFPSVILHPGETYRTTTVFRFSAPD